MASQPQANPSPLPRSTGSPSGTSRPVGDGEKGTHELQADRKVDVDSVVYDTTFTKQQSVVDDDATSIYEDDGDDGRDDETSAAEAFAEFSRSGFDTRELCSPESYAEFSGNPYLCADPVQDDLGNPEPVQKAESGGGSSPSSSVSRRESIKAHKENVSETFTKLSKRLSGVYRRYSTFNGS
ncbi:hypothetical protein Hte_008511 [Hypoxylon texense]